MTQDFRDLDFSNDLANNRSNQKRNNHSNIKSKEQDNTVSIAIFFILLLFGFVIFIVVIYSKIISDRKMPKLEISKEENAQRGSIYSSDGFNLSSSNKLYKVSVVKKSINPDKMDLFVKLFSIYSNIDEMDVLSKLKRSGHIILSYNITPKYALNLKQLNQKLIKYGIFREYEDNGRIMPKSGLNIEISGESRDYLYKDILEPVIGYTNKLEDNGLTKPKGIKGLEKFYNNVLESKQNGIYNGDRDIGFNIILSKDATLQRKVDGDSIVLTIPLKLQKKIENIIDEFTPKLDAKEISVGIMDSNTGKILALASSNRFDPKNIKSSDYGKLNPSFVEFSFEPGSVMKPIIYSILIEKRLVTPNEIFNLHNGYYKLGKYTIRDSNPQKYAIAENVIVLSSNIGMIQMAQRLSSSAYRNGLAAFGFSFPSNIDLPYEKSGLIPSVSTLQSHVYKGSVSYGYGIRTTFIQMLRAYAIFSNNGYLITPYIREYNISQNNKKINVVENNKKINVLGEYTVDSVQKTLIKTVDSGTAKQAKVDGIIVGGKTGTARLAVNGKYGDKYIGSFFGFAKDENNSNYTIGVVVFESSVNNRYYSSQTAAPIAKKVITALIQEGYLKKNSNI